MILGFIFSLLTFSFTFDPRGSCTSTGCDSPWGMRTLIYVVLISGTADLIQEVVACSLTKRETSGGMKCTFTAKNTWRCKYVRLVDGTQTYCRSGNIREALIFANLRIPQKILLRALPMIKIDNSRKSKHENHQIYSTQSSGGALDYRNCNNIAESRFFQESWRNTP